MHVLDNSKPASNDKYAPAIDDGPRTPHRKYMANAICIGLVQAIFRYKRRS